MPQTDKTKLFYLLPPRSRILILLLHEKHTFFIFWRFLTDHHIWCSLAEGLPYLVIALKSTKARSFWTPAANTKAHNWLDRLPSTTTSKTAESLKFLIFSSRTFKISRKLKPSNKIPSFLKIIQNFFDGGISQLSEERKKLLFKDQATQQKELDAVYQNIIKVSNKMLVSKITNPGRVHLARKLSN